MPRLLIDRIVKTHPLRIIALLVMVVLLPGCAGQETAVQQQRYEASFLTLFDTVTTVVGYADSEESFRAEAQSLHDELLVYHQLFDIYHTYPGMNNLKTVNDNAGKTPVKTDRRLIDMLLVCRELYEQTDGRVNAAMGSVLSLWHEARTEGVDDPENAALPDMEALRAAAEHMDFNDVIIDEEASTVFLRDEHLRLDVGAIAKGYAVGEVCKQAPAGLLVSVGGNVCATGSKPDGSAWVVGIQDPDGGDTYLHTLRITEGAIVTSGDYQRYYTVDGQRYHHIIDPTTLMPSTLWRCVTVLGADSGIADALSTALFLLPMEEGQALLERYGAEAMWVTANGEELFSPGFSQYIKT